MSNDYFCGRESWLPFPTSLGWTLGTSNGIVNVNFTRALLLPYTSGVVCLSAVFARKLRKILQRLFYTNWPVYFFKYDNDARYSKFEIRLKVVLIIFYCIVKFRCLLKSPFPNLHTTDINVVYFSRVQID